MPILESSFIPPKRIFKLGDLSTIYAATMRNVSGVYQSRKRIELPDGDFLDVEWSYAQHKTKTCAILLHGLEGHAKRPYILGSAKALNANGIDTCALYYRDCSEERNRLFCSYHSGRTEDLDFVVNHVLEHQYDNIILKGFSLGGNLALKYAANHMHPAVKGVIAVSTPIDLTTTIDLLDSPRNFIYQRDFLKTLKRKLLIKQKKFPNLLSAERIKKIRSIREYDDYYTARANGFGSAMEYYQKCSSKPDLHKIKVPTFIINAQNDSFLSEACYPIETAENHANIFLEMPQYGGHVGFVDRDNFYYNERRTIAFVPDYLSINKNF